MHFRPRGFRKRPKGPCRQNPRVREWGKKRPGVGTTPINKRTEKVPVLDQYQIRKLNTYSLW